MYEPGQVLSFDGVLGKDLSNPIPEWAEHGADKETCVRSRADMNTPWPDPGEELPHINTQLFGILDEANRGTYPEQTFNTPDYPTQQPSMDGPSPTT